MLAQNKLRRKPRHYFSS